MGKVLADNLNRLIDEKIAASDGDLDRATVVAEMAAATGTGESGIDAGTVNQILDGESIDCPPVDRLEAFADYFGVSQDTVIEWSAADGCPVGSNAPSEEEARAGFKKHIRNALIKKLSIRAMVDSSTIDEENRTVEVTFATDTPVLRHTWDGRYFEVLEISDTAIRSERLDSGAPVLNDHNSWGVGSALGVVENWGIRNGVAVATLRFSDRDEKVRGIWKDIVDKILRNVSVGYRVHKFEQVDAGGGETIGDVTPTFRAVDWEPFEISMTTIPADVNCGVRSDADPKEIKLSNHVVYIEKRKIKNITVMPDGKDDKNKQPQVSDEQRAAIQQEAQKVERQRAADIREAVNDAKLDSKFADKLIADGISADAARKLVLKEWGKRDDKNFGGGNKTTLKGKGEVEKRREAMVDGQLIRGGAGKDLSDDRKRAANKYRHESLLDLCKIALRNSGENPEGMSNREIVKRAITSSTSDLPNLLSGLNRQTLLANYQAVSDTWKRFCSVGSVSDFRQWGQQRMGSFSVLDQVDENGEFTNKALPDTEKFNVQVKTYGNTINVSRQMIINDDLNGIMRYAAMLGRAAGLSIEASVYALLAQNAGLGPDLADTNPLFHASRNNIGTGAALSVEAIDADAALMAGQTGPSSNEILGLEPQKLLLPRALRGEAMSINAGQFVPGTEGQQPNYVKDMFNDIIGTARLTGTRRYLFADPGTNPVFEVSFLNGAESPFMDMEEGFNVDGVKWKVRLDYGVDVVGFRGGVTNAGA